MFALAEREVPLRVRESARARRITVRIDAAADSVELVLPRRVSLAAGLRFLDARRDWLAAHLAEMPEQFPAQRGDGIRGNSPGLSDIVFVNSTRAADGRVPPREIPELFRKPSRAFRT